MKSEKEITKSELIESISNRQRHLGMKDIELSVKSLLDCIALSLSQGNRVEVRGCLLYTSPSPRDRQKSRMPSSA